MMTVLACVFFFTTILLAIVFFFSVRRSLELVDIINDMNDQVEESLDILDQCYGRIASVCDDGTVMSDEPVVRQLLNDIKHTRHAVLLVANKLVSVDQGDEPQDQDEQDN